VCVCSIETAKQKLELDRMHKEAEERKQERRKKLAELQSQFQALLEQNQSLPEHIRLHRSVHCSHTPPHSLSYCSVMITLTQ